ncbi:hypothetical protein BIFGAL_02772 [Bifidobacterium gallicum DSM 20093 = LMG 11596]|uniref:Uncharacterized protein n=1 Tax=Bifidobacterium gallicum DSM 20093 = LMG 11596 TaxID=561180 RepID=D1NSL4_9BIFI|nr:hypothetical protein BIFGAL_02772 [Bifidobacterium gallicum DSM 20093 = LMG 11596]KFI58724.1 hypothetical protein BGLCM_1556 [Bifidobacterium gallicum DSM 20093 = LMG 11596]
MGTTHTHAHGMDHGTQPAHQPHLHKPTPPESLREHLPLLVISAIPGGFYDDYTRNQALDIDVYAPTLQRPWKPYKPSNQASPPCKATATNWATWTHPH